MITAISTMSGWACSPADCLRASILPGDQRKFRWARKGVVLPVEECLGDRSGSAALRLRRLMQEVGCMPRYAIVEAPSALGHVPEHLGVERAPEVLLAAGLADGLAARRAGRVEAAGYSADRDPGTQVMNPQAIRDYSPLLADAVTAVLG